MELLEKLVSHPIFKAIPIIIAIVTALVSFKIIAKNDAKASFFSFLIALGLIYIILQSVTNYVLKKKVEELQNDNNVKDQNIASLKNELHNKTEAFQTQRKFSRETIRDVRLYLKKLSYPLSRLNTEKSPRTKKDVSEIIENTNSIEYTVNILEGNIDEWKII